MRLDLKLIVLSLQLFIINSGFSQIVFIPVPVDKVPSDYEHGFLPGGKFPVYKTIYKYDFNGLKIRVELFDDRLKLNLNKINCSGIEITNTSEFNNPKSIYKVKNYLETIFAQSNLSIDTSSENRLEVRLEALDARLLGFGYIEVHGLCQVRFKYKEWERTYCTDIKDGDKHSPIGRFSFVTRRGAIRKMTSAAIRDNIEQFLIELKRPED